MDRTQASQKLRRLQATISHKFQTQLARRLSARIHSPGTWSSRPRSQSVTPVARTEASPSFQNRQMSPPLTSPAGFLWNAFGPPTPPRLEIPTTQGANQIFEDLPWSLGLSDTTGHQMRVDACGCRWPHDQCPRPKTNLVSPHPGQNHDSRAFWRGPLMPII